MKEVVQFVAQLAATERRSINVDKIKKIKTIGTKRYDFFKSIWKKRKQKNTRTIIN